MTKWGRGWEVSIRKAIYQQQRVYKVAALILAKEHGSVHQPGERTDMCPKCKEGPHDR